MAFSDAAGAFSLTALELVLENVLRRAALKLEQHLSFDGIGVTEQVPYCGPIIIILCIKKNNNLVLNSSCGRLQELIWLKLFPMGTRKYFFEICGHFGHAPFMKGRQPCCKD